MKIAETSYTVSKSGGLRIPSSALKEMGLTAGDHVRVAYLTSDGVQNDCREFLISGEAFAEAGEREPKIGIPVDLLAQANIPQDADLQIVCCDGYIIISRDAALSIDEVSAVLSALETAEGIVSQFPNGTGVREIGAQLHAAINGVQERSEDD